MRRIQVFKSLSWGAGAAALLLLLFVLAVRLLSGNWQQVSLQARELGLYLVLLAVGFGFQVALWKFLKQRHRQMLKGHGVTVVSGSTSTVGMLACCTHYLANLVPVLGLGGLAGVLTAYQIPILTASLGINLLGIAYLVYLLQKSQSLTNSVCHSSQSS